MMETSGAILHVELTGSWVSAQEPPFHTPQGMHAGPLWAKLGATWLPVLRMVACQESSGVKKVLGLGAAGFAGVSK